MAKKLTDFQRAHLEQARDVRMQNFHWHVSGPHFRDYHLLLDEQAAQIFAMTDPLTSRMNTATSRRRA